MRWLLPRLPAFHAGSPAIKVSVRQTHTPESWLDLPFDVAIRRGDQPSARLATTTFLREDLILVAAVRSSLGEIDRLGEMPLLEADTRPGELSAWLVAARTRLGEQAIPKRGRPTRFAHFYIALEAALQGQGLLVAPSVVVGNLVDEGALDVLFPQISVPGRPYWLGFDPQGPKVEAVQQFSGWLLETAGCPASGDSAHS